MDNIKIRERGLLQNYHPDSIHRDIIYFAEDVGQILLNGVNYGEGSTKETIDITSEKALQIIKEIKRNSIVEDNFDIDIFNDQIKQYNFIYTLPPLSSYSTQRDIPVEFTDVSIYFDGSIVVEPIFASAWFMGDGQKLTAVHGGFRGTLDDEELTMYNVDKIVKFDKVNNTSDRDKPISTKQQQALDLKVDKIPGKGLSQNDFTNQEKEKLNNTALVLSLTQMEYDSLETKDPDVVYYIKDMDTSLWYNGN